jgi:hypothetical protein
MRRRAFKHSRWKLGAAFVAVICVSALTVWFVLQALPSDAHVLYRYDLEPKWDSCDGRPGTFGWDNVVVQIHFESSRPTDAVVQGADQTFRELGWNPGYVNKQSTFTQVGWTRRLDNGSMASAELSSGVPDQSAATPRWDLFVTAPPVGPQASGC